MLHQQTNDGRETFHADVCGSTLMGGLLNLLPAVSHK